MLQKPDHHRRGVVLLIVLGMLSLFTVLVISFVVFSSQMARSAFSNKERQRTAIPIDEPIESALQQLLVGTDNSQSAAFGHSLFEDMYGSDGVQMRVGHLRGNTPRTNLPIHPRFVNTGQVYGGMLLLPLINGGPNNGQPETTLFKFPTNLVSWFDTGFNSTPPIEPAPGDATLSPVNNNRFHVEQRPDLDDVFAGRLITFDEGPLAGVTFRVIRSFGRQNGEPPAARQANPPPSLGSMTPATIDQPITVVPHMDYNSGTYVQDEYDLAGCFVIDLAQMPDETIIFEGTSQPLYQVASNFPNALIYGPGPDGAPGNVGDDNGDGSDDALELGFPGSDDVGYRFTMNGVPFNGRGQNPSGLTGIGRDGAVIDEFADMELQVNGSLMGPTIRPGNSSSTGAFPEPDEQWDAAGLENLFLAWQPSDHRRVNTNPNPPNNFVAVYPNAANVTELHRQLGQHIVPSFHRPAVINYLMNAPIWIQQDLLPQPSLGGAVIDRSDPAYQRNFATIAAAPNFNAPFLDHFRLQALVVRLRRATMRPLNFSHNVFLNERLSDLDGDGSPFDGTPGFSGSNPTPITNETIDLGVDITVPANFTRVVGEIRRLALWLVNGPWDVDNDGDGLPDSVWVDMGLPSVVAPDGTLIRPMVAPLIEDLDGKLNVNFAGNLFQLIENRFIDGPTRANGDRRYYGDLEYLSVQTSLDSFGFGGGVGPGEIDFSHLFLEPPVPTGYNGPLSTSQIGNRLSFVNNPAGVPPTIGLLRSRYGNLLNVRNGGPVYDYLNPYPTLNEHFLPAAGTPAAPLPTTSTLAKIPFPSRQPGHTPQAIVGRPMDMIGTATTRKDKRGNQRFTLGTVGAVASDTFNHVYEAGVMGPLGDDTPFTPTDYIDMLENGRIGGRLAALLGDAIQRNEALRNLLATESRSTDSPEVPGVPGLMRLLAEKLTTAGVAFETQQSHLDRMMAVELRKGSKLNLNRALGNGENNDTTQLYNRPVSPPPPATADTVHDETRETQTRVVPNGGVYTSVPNNLRSGQRAFPQVAATHPPQATANANYTPMQPQPSNFGTPDFDGYDVFLSDGITPGQDGILDIGTNYSFDIDGDGTDDYVNVKLRAPTGEELLARHLYVLMFTLIHDPNNATPAELVPNFPYPSPSNFTSVPARNRYVARRIAQWAVNVVDFRDSNAIRTRLRYDPNPFDGFDPAVAALNTVWGMERPEVELSEAIAMHDKRTKRELQETGTQPNEIASDIDADADMDGDPTTGQIPDTDMDQFRMPLASAYVELHSLRSPDNGNAGVGQSSYPREFYTTAGQLDLGRIVGTGNRRSPVWRLAVGSPTGNDLNKSTRWMFDADRLGRDLVATDGRTEELDYLVNNNPDWTDPMLVTDFRDNTWDAGQRHSAEINHIPFPFPAVAGTERVSLADPDFNPGNVGLSEIQLERFVWFANLTPDPSLDLMDPAYAARSGMNRSNVYFNRESITTPGAGGPTTTANLALLNPGEYAVVGPRQSTRFGQTTTSVAPTWEYHPVEQRLEYVLQGASTNFRLDYYDLQAAPTQPMTPRYEEDNAGAYHIRRILPIVAQALYPHEVDALRTDWNTYVNTTTTSSAERVDMGFNISAPLPGTDFYPAPTHRVSANGATIDGVTGYPLVDGYRDYDSGTGLHPDVPFDQDDAVTIPRPPLSIPSQSPMAQNSYTAVDPGGANVNVFWHSIGTHQEVRTILLQRLADPTRPYHAIDNPYLTEDFIPIDLTTYNGEADSTEPVDRNGDGDPLNDNYFADSGSSHWDPGTPTFTPPVKMDSRRKIPAVNKDRALTALVPNGGGGTIATGYDRVSKVNRSPLSATFSILRPSTINATTNAFWEYEIGSAWDNQNYTTDDGLATDDVFDTRFNPTLTFDTVATPYTQTLGFVNREYGFPIRSDQYQDRTPASLPLEVGQPLNVNLISVDWLDREFQSPMEIMSVPASSRTGILANFSPGTLIDGAAGDRELPDNFGHLLGFERGYARWRQEDTQFDNGGTPQDRLRLGITEDVEYANFNDRDPTTDSVGKFTGARAGFEQIFDYVDIGPVAFDSQRWFDPSKIVHRTNALLSGQTALYQQRAARFNRVVTTLQPPYNYIGNHRTPGKVNLNTTPDYIRKGPAFTGPTINNFLDGQEVANTPNTVAAMPNFVRANPRNDNANFDGFTPEFLNSRLFGNGSVYRSLAHKFSTPYELDFYIDASGQYQVNYGSPSVMGENNAYERSVDTPFGRSFKAFIESRRGYASAQRGTANLLNPELDWRYPTRFAGVFGTARSAALGSVQRFMRTDEEWTPTDIGVIRRTHDMGLMRPHPDFDERLIPAGQRTTHANAGDPSFTLAVESDPTGNTINDGDDGGPNDVSLPPATGIHAASTGLRMSMLRSGLFERPQAELHSNFRHLDRDASFRFRNAGQIANLTSNHSNVFLIRLTTGYFIVDPVTGAVREEYTDATGEPIRTKAKFIVDRTIPVGFLRGKELNTRDAVIYSEITE